MSFEYRELTVKVLLNAGEGDKSPCRHASCRHATKDDDHDDCCASCGTTTKGCDTQSCDQPPGDDEKKKHDREGLKTLALLRQQLRDSLAAG